MLEYKGRNKGQWNKFNYLCSFICLLPDNRQIHLGFLRQVDVDLEVFVCVLKNQTCRLYSQKMII